MNNNFLASKLDSEYIKDLTILKLKKNYKVIGDEEYKNMLLDLTMLNGYSDFTEMLSMTAFEMIIDRIENMESNEESQLLGIGIINKYLSSFECKCLTLTVVQPNLMESSIYGTTVNKFLHQYDFSLLWE